MVSVDECYQYFQWNLFMFPNANSALHIQYFEDRWRWKDGIVVGIGERQVDELGLGQFAVFRRSGCNIPPLSLKIYYIPGDNKIIADTLFSRDAYRDVIFCPKGLSPDSGPDPQYNYSQTEVSSGMSVSWLLWLESRYREKERNSHTKFLPVQRVRDVNYWLTHRNKKYSALHLRNWRHH